jgi:hypothetical protein
MQIDLFEEHSTVPYNPLGEEFEKLADIDEWQLVHNPRRLAASYTLLAYKSQKTSPNPQPGQSPCHPR